MPMATATHDSQRWEKWYNSPGEAGLNVELNMTRIEQLENDVTALPETEYAQFRRWFLERDSERWDREIEADAKSGKLDFLFQEAISGEK
jgi:hypothetical protein